MQELRQDMEEGSHCPHHGPSVHGGWGGGGHGGGVWFGTAGLSILTSQLRSLISLGCPLSKPRWSVGGSESPPWT